MSIVLISQDQLVTDTYARDQSVQLTKLFRLMVFVYQVLVPSTISEIQEPTAAKNAISTLIQMQIRQNASMSHAQNTSI